MLREDAATLMACGKRPRNWATCCSICQNSRCG